MTETILLTRRMEPLSMRSGYMIGPPGTLKKEYTNSEHSSEAQVTQRNRSVSN